jgi:hypothetical protein
MTAAVEAFYRQPSVSGLAALSLAAVNVLNASLPTPPAPWKRVQICQPNAGTGSAAFTEIRILADRHLTDAEVSQVSGCLGYALTETLRGEELSLPTVARYGEGADGITDLRYRYDSDTSIRTAPDHRRAFEVASVYLVQGTPVRTTDRAGIGTRGTRLVEGLNDGTEFTLYVR